MERRKFIETVCAASVVASTGLAGCTSFTSGESGGDGGDGSDSGGDGNGGGGNDGSGDGGDGGDSGDGGMTSTDTPTESATSSPTATMNEATVTGGSRAPYDDWASSATYASEGFQAFSVQAGAGQGGSQTPTPTPTPTPEGTDAPVDPILGYPTQFLLAALFSGFALANFNLGQIASETGPAERIHAPGNSLVFEGTYDTDSLASKVGESDATESGTYEGYTLYEMGSGEDAATLAFSEAAVVHASADEQVSDPRSVVEATIDAGAGNATRYGSENAAYDDLVTALPTEQIMGIAYAPGGDVNTPTPTPAPGEGGGSSFFEIRPFQLEGTVRGYASALSFPQSQDQESVTVRMAIRYASASEVDDRSRIAEQAAPRAPDVSVNVSGPLAVVAATYTEGTNL